MTLRLLIPSFLIFLLVATLHAQSGRVEQDFNYDWTFHIGDGAKPGEVPKDKLWQPVRLPHDWSIGLGFSKENTGCSTGFLPAGIGWYRKSFLVPNDWKGARVAIVFDGIYKQSSIWLNGVKIGVRPSGFVSFTLDLTPHLRFDGKPNVLEVRVDHSAYLDTRWYCGSGIYRDVRLVRTAPTHIPEWGVRIVTPDITNQAATVEVETEIARSGNDPGKLEHKLEILDPDGNVVARGMDDAVNADRKSSLLRVKVPDPRRWSVESPSLYQARVSLLRDGRELDHRDIRFGIRSARFDPNRGFLLNDKPVKIRGVNLHHDAGLVGVAVPDDVWRERLGKLKSVGVNAIRTAHNPHDPILLDLSDELGLLVMGETFDEWRVPKDKSLNHVGDNKAPAEAARGYSEFFDEWAERDLKDAIRRDRNHPSIILWSIGNEIEWTYPYYPKSSSLANDSDYHAKEPDFDPVKIRERMAKLHDGPDELLETVKHLTAWVREIDPTRPITAGLVHPSVGFATGYAQTLDVVGFNYRRNEYDGAHRAYPDACLIGTENWGTRDEWEAARSRDFVAGLFIWTGYAYLGEAGPWPRKGLEISLFDFAGFQTPRGHLFEAMWSEKPKVWVGASRASESEHVNDSAAGWTTIERPHDPPETKWLRKWEWDRVAAEWNFQPAESTVVQAYGNTDEMELFLNERSLGRLRMEEIPDRIGKWLVPFEAGELKLVGSDHGKVVTEQSIRTHGDFSQIELTANRSAMRANRRDVARIELLLRDANGVPVVTKDREVEFLVDGPARVLGVDNGWENSVQRYDTTRLTTREGRALLLVQSTDQAGSITIRARPGETVSPPVTIRVTP